MSSLDFQVEKRKNNFVINTGLPFHEFNSNYPSESSYLSAFLVNDEYVVPKHQLCNVLDRCFDHFTEEGLIHITKLLDKNDDMRERIHEQSVSKKKQKKDRHDYKFQDSRQDFTGLKSNQEVSAPKARQEVSAPKVRQELSVPRQELSATKQTRQDDVTKQEVQKQDVQKHDFYRQEALVQKQDVQKQDVQKQEEQKHDFYRQEALVQRHDSQRQDSQRQDVYRKEYKQDVSRFKQESQDYTQDHEFKLKSDLLKMFYQMKSSMEQMERYLLALK